MNWVPFGAVVPGPVEFGALGAIGWLLIAVAAAVPVSLAVNEWFEIGVVESFNAIVDLLAPNEVERRPV
jgi:hypothetical protein